MAVEELYLIAAAMRRAGAGGIARDTAVALRAGGPPIRAAVEASVLAKLPHRGGLAAWVAASRFGYRVRSGGDVIAAVKVGKTGHDLRGLDEGLVIHPFYGHGPWFNQPVLPGTISNPIQKEGGNQLKRAGVIAIDRAAIMIISA